MIELEKTVADISSLIDRAKYYGDSITIADLESIKTDLEFDNTCDEEHVDEYTHDDCVTRDPLRLLYQTTKNNRPLEIYKVRS